MGVAIDTYAFPSSLPKTGYNSLIGKDLVPLTTVLGDLKYRIYAAVYEPKTGTPRCTVLYAHGNGETLAHIHYFMAAQAEQLQARFVPFDWEGYGQAEGVATEAALRRGAEAVFSFVKTRYKEKIVVWGRSIGTVAAVHLAGAHALSCCVLQSPMASALNVVFRRRWTSCGCVDGLDNQNGIRNVRCPVAIIHGTHDAIVSYKNAQLVYSAYLAANGADSDSSVVQPTEQVVKNVADGVNMRRFKDMVFYTIVGGGHNNLDSAYKAQSRWVGLEVLGKLSQ